MLSLGEPPRVPDGRLSKEEEFGLSGQATWKAWLFPRIGRHFHGYGLRTVVRCWDPGLGLTPRMFGRALCSSLLTPVGLCDLRLVTGSPGSRAKDKESFWGFGHLGKVQE